MTGGVCRRRHSVVMGSRIVTTDPMSCTVTLPVLNTSGSVRLGVACTNRCVATLRRTVWAAATSGTAPDCVTPAFSVPPDTVSTVDYNAISTPTVLT